MFVAPGGEPPPNTNPQLDIPHQVADAWNLVNNFFGVWGRGTYNILVGHQVAAKQARL